MRRRCRTPICDCCLINIWPCTDGTMMTKPVAGKQRYRRPKVSSLVAGNLKCKLHDNEQAPSASCSYRDLDQTRRPCCRSWAPFERALQVVEPASGLDGQLPASTFWERLCCATSFMMESLGCQVGGSETRRCGSCRGIRPSVAVEYRSRCGPRRLAELNTWPR